MIYHLIGIKGSGMRALADILIQCGYSVTGSDLNTHSVENIKNDMVIIKSSAIKEDNIELIEARKKNLVIFDYAQFLGQFLKNHELISVAGCHGKTTTTALIAHIINDTIGCSYLIGDGTGEYTKDSRLFILESCEYKRNFLNYNPHCTIVTNIDLDHVDYYTNINDVFSAYQQFVYQTKDTVIGYGDDAFIRRLKFNNSFIYYGLNKDNNVVANNIIQTTDGTYFDAYINNVFLDRFFIPIPGKHMILNSLATITLCTYYGIDRETIKERLYSFKGAKKRFNCTEINDTSIVESKADSPAEIATTIEAVRQKYPNKKIVGIVIPHSYSRVKYFYKAYAEVLNGIDKAYIMDVEPGREKAEDYLGINTQMILNNMNNGEHISIDTVDKLRSHLGSVIVFMLCKDALINNGKQVITDCYGSNAYVKKV